jgi:hypothetical protein
MTLRGVVVTGPGPSWIMTYVLLPPNPGSVIVAEAGAVVPVIQPTGILVCKSGTWKLPADPPYKYPMTANSDGYAAEE